MRLASDVHNVWQLIGVVGLLVVILAKPSSSADYPDTAVLRCMGEIQANLYNDRYEQARVISDSLTLANPSNPLPLLVWAGLLVGEMKEKEENLYEEELFALLKRANKLAVVLSRSPIDSVRAWAFLALGHTWAYRSLWEARFGSAAQAYRRGKQAKAYYRQGLETDSTLYDLYAGIGEYNYWKSTKAGFLRSLGLIHNEKQIGIEQVSLAADSSLVSQASARRGLMWIYLDDDQYDSAIAIAKLMHTEYPGGRAFVWALAQAYFQKEEYAEAIVFLEKMRRRITAPPENYHKLISVDHMIATSYQALGEPDQACHTAFMFTKYQSDIPDYVRREQKKKIKFLKKLVKEAKSEKPE